MTRLLQGAYIARLDLTEQHLAGVAAKIRGQIGALETLPARVQLIHPANGSILIDGQPWKAFGTGRFSKRWTYYFRFYRELWKRKEPLDFVYIRYQGCSPFLLSMLRNLRRRRPGIVILIEVPSYPYHTEARSLRERAFMLVDRITRGQLRHYVDRIVTFSRETQIFGTETIRTDNGVGVANITMLPRPNSAKTLHLLGLANLSFWHGYDRVITGLAAYRANGGKRDVYFDIVGSGSELEPLKALARRLGVIDHIKFWGTLRGEALDKVVAQAHLGISSIGMHRLNVDTTNIKSREFCARGIPFVVGYRDRDFDPSQPFVLHIPPDESPLDIENLILFCDRLALIRGDYRSLMRDYAVRHLDWSAKMQPVIEAIRSLMLARG